MFENTKVKSYVKKNKNDLDKIMKDIFGHWNKIGKLSKDEKSSNKMQIIFLISIVRVWVKSSGMPKKTQKEVLKKLIESL